MSGIKAVCAEWLIRDSDKFSDVASEENAAGLDCAMSDQLNSSATQFINTYTRLGKWRRLP